MKLTKRKSFSFYRSYYDVFNELSDNDKLLFIEALLDKQFLDVDPVDLSGMVKFAYISQMDSIEKQVKGYCDKTKTALNPQKTYPWQGVDSDPKQGVAYTPIGQEKEKEKEKLITTIYKKFVDEIKKGNFDSRVEALYMNLKIKHGTLTELLKEYQNHLISENRLHKNTNEYFINFKNWLNVQDRYKKLDKYR